MKIQYIIGILVALPFISCSYGEEEQKLAYGKIDAAVSVILLQPESADMLARADGPHTNTDIKSVDLLISDKDAKFVERIKVENSGLVITGAGTSSMVRLDATSRRRIIHLVTSGRGADSTSGHLGFDDITPGMAENVTISSLQTASLEHVNKGESTLLNHVVPLVMWGHFVLSGVNAAMKTEDVKLLRSTVCIQVKGGSGDVDTGLGNFVIEGITMHRGAYHGFLTLTGYTGEVNTPVAASPVIGGTYLDYRKGRVNNTKLSLYIYERNCSASNYIGVVIAARYKDKEGCYKVVVIGNGEAPLNIACNHRYIVMMVGVNDPGCEDPGIAAASVLSNILKVELTDEDTGLPCIVADNEHRVALSNNVSSLYRKTGVTTSVTGIDIYTVYSSHGVQPILILSTDCNWLTNLSAQTLGNSKYRVTGDFILPANSAVFATLTVICDNLSQLARVSWSPIIPDQRDTNSFAFDLVSSTDYSWTIRVLNPTSADWLLLYSSATSPGAFPGDGMMSKSNSKYSSRAHSHITFGVNRRGTVLITSAFGGETVAHKIVVIQ